MQDATGRHLRTGDVCYICTAGEPALPDCYEFIRRGSLYNTRSDSGVFRNLHTGAHTVRPARDAFRTAEQALRAAVAHSLQRAKAWSRLLKELKTTKEIKPCPSETHQKC
jgi:hypothetical protein